MYKIFRITYNDGDWPSGPPLHFFYIAQSKEEVIANSKQYQYFLESQKYSHGDIWIDEVNGLPYDFEFENFADFEITVSVRKVE